MLGSKLEIPLDPCYHGSCVSEVSLLNVRQGVFEVMVFEAERSFRLVMIGGKVMMAG